MTFRVKSGDEREMATSRMAGHMRIRINDGDAGGQRVLVLVKMSQSGEWRVESGE